VRKPPGGERFVRVDSAQAEPSATALVSIRFCQPVSRRITRAPAPARQFLVETLSLHRSKEPDTRPGVFNRDGSKILKVDLNSKDLGLDVQRDYRLKNLWTGEILPAAETYPFEIPPDGVVFLYYCAGK
jgi:Alpha galactosidase C-terminal beta sandwich domain